MLKWTTRRSAPATRPALRLETLEAREVPAVFIQVDYTYDTGFFKNNPAAREVIERVASDIGNSIDANLAAITPGGGNQWTATFFNPADGSQASVPNMAIGANTIKLFVGGRDIPGAAAGFGGPGGYGISGTQAWINTVQTRGHGGFAPWGGSITFDTGINWHYGVSTVGLDAQELDLYTVAVHELGHVLGIGTSSQWSSRIAGGVFTGANAQAVYGAPVPVSPAGDHWADGITIGGVAVSMDPSSLYGQRIGWTALDAAALRDIGWVGTAAAPGAAPAPAAGAAGAVGTTFGGLATGSAPVAINGNFDGTVSLFVYSGGTMVDTGHRITPFAGYLGALRVAGGDFNGDGVMDYAFATGPGPQAVVQVLDGRDGSILVNQTIIFEGFKGGLFIAAGDIDGDGIAELAVSADGGAGPHVQTFKVVGGQLQLQSSFFAFEDSFRGGVRVAIGDIDNDGCAELVVTTSGGSEGRAAVFKGSDLRNGVATRLMADFVPFAGFKAGLNATVGDMDGDGLAEVAFAPDRGGPGHVKVWSGSVLMTDPWTPASAKPEIISFYALEPVDNDGARLAFRDTNGDGKAELFVGSGSTTNARARVFTIEDFRTGNHASVPYTNPLGSVQSLDGLYLGLTAEPPPAAPASDDGAIYTAALAPARGFCNCGGCSALAALAAEPARFDELVPSIRVG